MPLTTGPHFSTSLDAFTAAAIPASSNHLHSSAFRTPGRSLPPLLSPSQFQSCAPVHAERSTAIVGNGHGLTRKPCPEKPSGHRLTRDGRARVQPGKERLVAHRPGDDNPFLAPIRSTLSGCQDREGFKSLPRARAIGSPPSRHAGFSHH